MDDYTIAPVDMQSFLGNRRKILTIEPIQKGKNVV